MSYSTMIQYVCVGMLTRGRGAKGSVVPVPGRRWPRITLHEFNRQGGLSDDFVSGVANAPSSPVCAQSASQPAFEYVPSGKVGSVVVGVGGEELDGVKGGGGRGLGVLWPGLGEGERPHALDVSPLGTAGLLRHLVHASAKQTSRSLFRNHTVDILFSFFK